MPVIKLPAKTQLNSAHVKRACVTVKSHFSMIDTQMVFQVPVFVWYFVKVFACECDNFGIWICYLVLYSDIRLAGTVSDELVSDETVSFGWSLGLMGGSNFWQVIFWFLAKTVSNLIHWKRSNNYSLLKNINFLLYKNIFLIIKFQGAYFPMGRGFCGLVKFSGHFRDLLIRFC